MGLPPGTGDDGTPPRFPREEEGVVDAGERRGLGLPIDVGERSGSIIEEGRGLGPPVDVDERSFFSCEEGRSLGVPFSMKGRASSSDMVNNSKK